jgi:dipicolinate synthase subunit B
LSYCAAETDTRFGAAREWLSRFERATGNVPLLTLTDVEPIGPKGYFDVLAVAPCTGSTLGRLANGLSDTPVTLAVKSQLRRGRPVVIAVSTNDALGFSMRNIALLKNSKNLYFVPLSQEHSQQLFVFWGLFHAFLNDFSHYSVSPVFSEIPPHGGIFSSII